MKKAIFATGLIVILILIFMLSGCSDDTQNTVSATEPSNEVSSERATKPKESATKSTQTEEHTETATETVKKLPLVKNNQQDYCFLRNTGIIGNTIFYSSDYLWEYHNNDITATLPQEIMDYTGKFFVLGDDIYFTPSYSDKDVPSVQLWKIKADGSNSEFITDDLSANIHCVYVNGYLLYNYYSAYSNSNFGTMALNLETHEKASYASINSIQYTYKGLAYYLDGNYIKYLNPETGDTGLVRNTGGSFLCGDGHYIYYISSRSGNGLFRIDLNNKSYSANEFVKSSVSPSCVVINNVVYYYPVNAVTTSKIMVYDIAKAKDLTPVDIGLTRKIYRFWNENGYLLFSVQNGSKELNMSDYIVNPDNKKVYRVSNYAMTVDNEAPTQPLPYSSEVFTEEYSY